MRPSAYRLLLACLLVLSALLLTRGAAASAPPARAPEEPAKRLAPAQATPEPTPHPDEGEEPERRTILQTIIQTIFFPFEKLAEGVRAALAELFQQTVEAALDPMIEALNLAGGWLLPEEGPAPKGGSPAAAPLSLREVRRTAWGAMIKVAAALMPLALVVTVGSAMKEGVTSVTGYADAREALLNWLIGVGAAATSLFLIERGVDLSTAAASGIRETLSAAIEMDWNLGDQLLGSLVRLKLLDSLPAVLQLFLGFFALVTMIAIVGSVIIALLAREVILLLLVAVAPVVLVLGSLRPLRWLSGLWTKALVIALLLGPLNLLLLGAAGLLAQKTSAAGSGPAGAILAMLVGVGVISVLVGLNSRIGKLVYGAAIEIAQKAWGSTLGVVQLAALAAGFALAPAAASLMAGGAASGASAGGPSAGAQPVGLSAARDVSSAAGAFGRSAPLSNLTSSIGSLMAGSRNPALRGFGQGMRAGGAAWLLEPASGGPLPPAGEALEVRAGLSAAGSEMTDRYAGSEKAAMERFGLPKEEAQARIGAGLQLSENAFRAMEALGVDQGSTLRDLGYLRGGDLTGAVASFGRATAGSWAFRHRSPYARPQPIAPPGPSLGGHDVQAALEIASSQGPAWGIESVSPALITQLSLTVHQRRTQLGEGLAGIVEEASRKGSPGRLVEWMRDTYYSLPDRDQAGHLGGWLALAEGAASGGSRFGRMGA